MKFLPGDAVESEPSIQSIEPETAAQSVEPDSAAPVVAREFSDGHTVEMVRGGRRNLVDRVRDWLRRAA